MFVSIHIPKTAGTSLAMIFDHGSNRRILYDYDLLRLEDLEDDAESEYSFLSQHKTFIEKKFDFIHGHFHSSKYLNIFPDAKHITCVRDPLKRLISHYQHIVDEEKTDYWLYNEIKSGNVDLVEFAKIPHIGDLQSRILSGIAINDYSHLFINELLAESVYQFQLIYGFKRNDPYMIKSGEESIPRINKKIDRVSPEISFSESQLSEARSILRSEFDLYNEALDIFKCQKKKADY